MTFLTLTKKHRRHFTINELERQLIPVVCKHLYLSTHIIEYMKRLLTNDGWRRFYVDQFIQGNNLNLIELQRDITKYLIELSATLTERKE